MKYLCLAWYDEKKFEALPPEEMAALVSQCPPHDKRLRESGRLLAQASLGAASGTRCIRPVGEKRSVTDGPFAETKEQIGGFFIIDAKDIDDAVQIASLHPAAQIGGQAGWGVEVRPIEHYQNSAGPL